MIQSIDDGRTWFGGGGGVALVIVISKPIIEKTFEGCDLGSMSKVIKTRLEKL